VNQDVDPLSDVAGDRRGSELARAREQQCQPVDRSSRGSRVDRR